MYSFLFCYLCALCVAISLLLVFLLTYSYALAPVVWLVALRLDVSRSFFARLGSLSALPFALAAAFLRFGCFLLVCAARRCPRLPCCLGFYGPPAPACLPAARGLSVGSSCAPPSPFLLRLVPCCSCGLVVYPFLLPPCACACWALPRRGAWCGRAPRALPGCAFPLCPAWLGPVVCVPRLPDVLGGLFPVGYPLAALALRRLRVRVDVLVPPSGPPGRACPCPLSARLSLVSSVLVSRRPLPPSSRCVRVGSAGSWLLRVVPRGPARSCLPCLLWCGLAAPVPSARLGAVWRRCTCTLSWCASVLASFLFFAYVSWLSLSSVAGGFCVSPLGFSLVLAFRGFRPLSLPLCRFLAFGPGPLRLVCWVLRRLLLSFVPCGRGGPSFVPVCRVGGWLVVGSCSFREDVKSANLQMRSDRAVEDAFAAHGRVRLRCL